MTMVLASPSHKGLNIFLTRVDTQIQQEGGGTTIDTMEKGDIRRNISDTNLTSLNVDNNSIKNQIRRNRFSSTSSLLNIPSLIPIDPSKTISFRTFSDSDNDEENNNVSELQNCRSLMNLNSCLDVKDEKYRKLPKIAPKPKRKISNLFSLKVNDAPIIENGSLDVTKPETLKIRTPNLFRKFSKAPTETKMDSLRLNSSHESLNSTNNGGGEVKKSRSFSLRSEDGSSLKLPGQKSFPLLRSPFSKSKLDHSANDDMKKKVYNEMLKSIQDGDCKRLKLLIKRRKTDINTFEYNLSLIHEAAFKACVKCTKALIKAGWSVELADHSAWKPLHAAVFGHSLETVKVLLDRGARVDDVTSDGLTPLHIAVHTGDLYIVHELIKNGSNPLISTHFSDTPFQLAINLKKDLILDYMLLQSCFLVDGS